MKNLKLFLILLILLPVIAQDTDKESQNVQDTQDLYLRKGLILAVEPGKINFEEMWLPIPNPESKMQSHLIFTVTNEFGGKIEYGHLTAPFLAEIVYLIINDQKIVTKIKLLKQYRYNDDGFVKE